MAASAGTPRAGRAPAVTLRRAEVLEHEELGKAVLRLPGAEDETVGPGTHERTAALEEGPAVRAQAEVN